MSRRKVIPLKHASRGGTEPVVVSRAWLEQLMAALEASDVCLRNALALSEQAKELLREHLMDSAAPDARARRPRAQAKASPS